MNGLIASSYYQLKDFSLSQKYFKKTTKLNPKSELASLGLFHSLMELGKTTAALKELHYYILHNTPKPYKLTISELQGNQDNFNKS